MYALCLKSKIYNHKLFSAAVDNAHNFASHAEVCRRFLGQTSNQVDPREREATNEATLDFGRLPLRIHPVISHTSEILQYTKKKKKKKKLRSAQTRFLDLRRKEYTRKHLGLQLTGSSVTQSVVNKKL